MQNKHTGQSFQEFMLEDKIREMIGQAMGQVSMCWIPEPSKQVFDSTKARMIYDQLVKSIMIEIDKDNGRSN